MVMVRRSLPFRVLCLLLIACVLCCSCLMPYAQAVVVESAVFYGAYELIAAMLIGGGVVYATSDDARSAAAQVYDWLATNASAALDKINFWVAQAIVGGVSTGIRVSQDIWDMLVSAFDSIFGGVGGSDFVEYGVPYSAATEDELDNIESLLSLDNALSNGVRAVRYHRYADDWIIDFTVGYQSDYLCVTTFLPSGQAIAENVKFVGDSLSDFGFCLVPVSSKWSALYVGYMVDGQFTSVDASVMSLSFGDYTFYPDSSFSGSADLVFPSDNSLVRVPDLPDVQTDEDGKEVVVYPDLSLNPTDHLADIPKQETGEQVDVPYDTLVDVGTGEAVGEGEGVENPDIPTEGTDTGLIQNILDKITNFFDSPSDYKLNFDGFKNLILPDRFPFCIPFDLINSVRVFAASAANFSFDIDLETSYFSVHHTVDLSPFAVPIAFFRYTCVLFWIWVLITRTRDLMKW